MNAKSTKTTSGGIRLRRASGNASEVLNGLKQAGL